MSQSGGDMESTHGLQRGDRVVCVDSFGPVVIGDVGTYYESGGNPPHYVSWDRDLGSRGRIPRSAMRAGASISHGYWMSSESIQKIEDDGDLVVKSASDVDDPERYANLMRSTVRVNMRVRILKPILGLHRGDEGVVVRLSSDPNDFMPFGVFWERVREEKWCPADAISLCGSEEHLVTSRTLDGETSFDTPLHLLSQKHDAVMSSFVESSSNSSLFDVGDRVYYNGGHPGPPYGTPGVVKKILTATDGFRRNIGWIAVEFENWTGGNCLRNLAPCKSNAGFFAPPGNLTKNIGDIDNQENRNTVTFSASHSSASLSVTADLERLSVTSCPDWLSRALVRAGINPDVFRRALERAIVPEDVLSILRDVANFAYRSDALDCPTWILPVLQDAGLDRSDFIAILRRNGNDMVSACQWLFDFIRPADCSSTHNESSQIEIACLRDKLISMEAKLRENELCLLRIENLEENLQSERERNALFEEQIAMNKKTCVICYDQDPDTVLAPCGHMCLCSACTDLLRTPKCPICQQQVERKIKVYM